MFVINLLGGCSDVTRSLVSDYIALLTVLLQIVLIMCLPQISSSCQLCIQLVCMVCAVTHVELNAAGVNQASVCCSFFIYTICLLCCLRLVALSVCL